MEQAAVSPDPAVLPCRRSAADQVVERLLRIPESPPAVREEDVQRLFSVSITISALRCLLSYVVFPIAAPALGAATGIGPALGIPIGLVALFFDVLGIRRFWLARHRWRWAMSAIYVAIMCMVATLLVGDIAHLAS